VVWGMGFHGGGWLIGLVLTFAFWALMFFVMSSLVRGRSPRNRGDEESNDAEHVLARRFASGEIDESEFHQRLDMLRAHDLANKH
jgi:putative membrane protein